MFEQQERPSGHGLLKFAWYVVPNFLNFLGTRFPVVPKISKTPEDNFDYEMFPYDVERR